VIDDGSTDRTAAIAENFAGGDDRVRVMRRAHEGLSATLNAGIAAVRGEYVARIDADDISTPDRLRKQVAYLDAHPACVAVGAWIDVVDEAGRQVGLKTFVTTHDEISAALLCGVSDSASDHRGAPRGPSSPPVATTRGAIPARTSICDFVDRPDRLDDAVAQPWM
jgi:glycosyltransferase involved in cell wall biosynthesis